MSLPAPRDVLVVGASLAGLRTAEALRARGYDGRLTVLGAEPHGPYDRPPLSKAALTAPVEELPALLDLTPALADVADAVHLGEPAIALDLQRREVATAAGRGLAYDALVIATGTTPILPAGLVPAGERPGGLHLLRTRDDALALRADLAAAAAAWNAPVVVLGAGFIGLELASTCHTLGLPVTLVDAAAVPLTRSLGDDVARHLLDQHRAAGTRLELGRQCRSVTVTDGRVSGIVLDDGRELPAAVVVVAVGVRPATGWLEGSGVPLDDGVVCDPDLAVRGVPGVVAVGDLARWHHPGFDAPVRVEHWSNAVEGADIAAGTLLGDPRPHLAVPSFWTDQLGTKIQGVGLPGLADRVEVEDASASGEGLLAHYHRGEDLVGAVAFGKPRRLMAARRALTERAERAGTTAAAPAVG